MHWRGDRGKMRKKLRGWVRLDACDAWEKVTKSWFGKNCVTEREREIENYGNSGGLSHNPD